MVKKFFRMNPILAIAIAVLTTAGSTVAVAQPTFTTLYSPITSLSPAVATTRADVGRATTTAGDYGYMSTTTRGSSTLMPNNPAGATPIALIGTGDATTNSALLDSATPTSAVIFTA